MTFFLNQKILSEPICLLTYYRHIGSWEAGGSRSSRFWQMRRRVTLLLALPPIPPDFKTLRHACIRYMIMEIPNSQHYLPIKFGLSEKHKKICEIFPHTLDIYLVNIQSMRKIFFKFRVLLRKSELYLVPTVWGKLTSHA